MATGTNGGRRVAWSGLAATAGGLLWTATPWAQAAVLGDRPYVASAFDVASLAGLLLVAVGLVGVRGVFGPRYGRPGRVGVGATAAGVVLVAVPTLRSALRFAAAGFRAVPAAGEGPAGLVVTWASLLGLTLAVCGAGALGVALRRVADPPRVAVVPLLAAPVVPAVVVGASLLPALPPSVGRLVVRTNAVLVPLGLGWAALGATVWVRSRPGGAESGAR